LNCVIWFVGIWPAHETAEGQEVPHADFKPIPHRLVPYLRGVLGVNGYVGRQDWPGQAAVVHRRVIHIHIHIHTYHVLSNKAQSVLLI
jgi:hypothetical protein